MSPTHLMHPNIDRLIYQVRSHPSNALVEQSAPRAAPARSTRASRTDAVDILGLRRRARGQENSVESEVDRYLNDSEGGTSALAYWQVVKRSSD